jgi:uncharacterized membrane protein YdbT with pleckstrin-like domain
MTKELLAIFRDSLETFEGQEPGEDVRILLRRHPFYVILRLCFFGLIALIPIVVGILFFDKISSLGLGGWFLAAACVYYLVLWLGISYTLMIYTLNVVIITDRRVIENDQYGFFDRRISELRNTRIQDASVKIGGFIETILHFGDITVQTAGTEKQFVFKQVPQAVEVKDRIMHIASAVHKVDL